MESLFGEISYKLQQKVPWQLSDFEKGSLIKDLLVNHSFIKTYIP